MNLPEDLFVTTENPGNTVHIYDREKDDAPFKKDGYRTSLCGQAWGKLQNERNANYHGDRRKCGTRLRILETRRAD